MRKGVGKRRYKSIALSFVFFLVRECSRERNLDNDNLENTLQIIFFILLPSKRYNGGCRMYHGLTTLMCNQDEITRLDGSLPRLVC